MTEKPTTETRSHGEEIRQAKKFGFWFYVALASLAALFGATIGNAFVVRERDSGRAEVAELKQKLEAQATDQTSCLKDNINLITWKVNAQLMLMEAADDLSFCAAHVPGRKFPRRRKLDLDDSFVGAEVFPPQ